MTRGKNGRLRLIPSHLPLIRDKIVEKQRKRLKRQHDATQYRKGDWSQRVAIPSEASDALARLVGGRRCGAVFREDSGARLRQQTAVGIVSSVALRVGAPGISPHSLRRTFCTLSRDAGVPDRDIMAAGGWNSPQMLDYYDMARRGLDGRAGDGLQRFLNNG